MALCGLRKRTVSLYNVVITRTVEDLNTIMDLEFYQKLVLVTNKYKISYVKNEYISVYNVFYHFKTCKDIFQLVEIFGDCASISANCLKVRKIK